MSRRILCVDAEEAARSETAETLRAELTGFDLVVEVAGTVAEAEAALTRDTAAVITEYSLPDGTGFDVIASARSTCPDAGCILYTDVDPDTIDTDELRGAITEYVGKGSVFGTERLTQLVETTIGTSSQRSYPLPQNETERLAALGPRVREVGNRRGLGPCHRGRRSAGSSRAGGPPSKVSSRRFRRRRG